ncbi:MAG: translation initiation factor IF-2 [Deltaproteobacteria bacterium]|nr:translation initiation factor IF-2 [Deltaproteobacteria bacterium]
MVTHSTTIPPRPAAPDMAPGKMVEKRLKPTLIRRRARAEEPAAIPPAARGPAEEVGAEAGPSTARPATVPPATGEAPSARAVATGVGETITERSKSVGTGAVTPLRPVAPSRPGEAAPEQVHKPARRKKSKEEWVSDDIRRAGGLKHFAYVADLLPGEATEESTLEPEAAPEAAAVTPEAAAVTPEAAVVTPEVTVAAPEIAPTAPEVPERIERIFRPGPRRRKKPLRREFKKTQITQMRQEKRVIRMEEQISLSELSQAMGVKGGELIQKLMQLGTMATLNQTVDADTAALLAQAYGFEIERAALKEEEHLAERSKSAAADSTAARPPVVTVMGHVDHGKTSLLDAVRQTDVASGEAGGITQHIGASEVTTPKGLVTFIDTPGHAAFTALRARGAKVTDVVVLVVAADDGVMPQTKEAIDHAKAAAVPIIVAINKIDKPEANPDRIKRELTEHGLVTEEWGGDVICVPTSARTRQGIDQLLEMILLQAEMCELKADPAAPARGTVIEARLDRGRGPVATVLVQEGTVRVGSSIVCGAVAGRVRSLVDARGQSVKEAGPGHAAEVVGLESVPVAGDQFAEATGEKGAKLIAENRLRKQREIQMARYTRVSLEDLHRQMEVGEVKSLSVIIKADVQGSAEAVAEALGHVGTEKAKVQVLHRGVGGITESDVLLAAASRAVIIGFNVVAEKTAAKLAAQEQVAIKRYSIIYELVDEVKKALQGLLEPTLKETVLGRAEVRQIFTVSKIGTIAGSAVVDGRLVRSGQARLLRDSVVVFQGKIASLRRFKDDAREVAEGMECGIGLERLPT